MRKICDKKEKIHKEGQKVRLSRGGQAGRGGWRGKAGAPERGGVPNGVPGGSADPVGKGGRAAAGRAARSGAEGQQTRWGKGGAPQRRGLPGMKWRVSTR